mmetsp:Transcript_4584/g.5177  ORF Transcript_4584/g.5177 Transcript_4584/m.5177 type:complete len:403 (+) Transcript_4584:58-1266(+)|eukprot:CAMPEP_0114981588 /NCGR_PEP_ID=MMETSP0216-20121206/5624_1 /TAXON_ID=223996 /ORGANISM="Protocruzia adherens, Strain Boccale" /LENGTH=402 /DNA_ID=CAMNT_0002343269 /DNA_START=86 /DNA_END=1294 /DNA_ORIENTATION=-
MTKILPLVAILLVTTSTVTSAMSCAEFAATHDHVSNFHGKSQTIESPHEYCDNMHVTRTYNHVGSSSRSVFIYFDPQSHLETNFDFLTFSWLDHAGNTIEHKLTGDNLFHFTIPTSSFTTTFTSDHSVTHYGYKFEAQYTDCAAFWFPGFTFTHDHPQVIESPHPYCPDRLAIQNFVWSDPSVRSLAVLVDPDSEMEPGDTVIFQYGSEWREIGGGHGKPKWFVVPGNQFTTVFYADSAGERYGYRVVVDPSRCGGWKLDRGDRFDDMRARVVESPHDYCDGLAVFRKYSWTDPAVRSIDIVFDRRSQTEDGFDSLSIWYTDSNGNFVMKTSTGTDFRDFSVDSSEFELAFISDGSITDWGFKLSAIPNTVGLIPRHVRGLQNPRSFLHEVRKELSFDDEKA